MIPFRLILHPTDFSATSNHALSVAASLARDYQARLILLHVTPTPVVVYGEGIVPPDPMEHRAAALRLLEEMRPLNGAVEVERRLVEGNDIAWEILQFAAERRCDAIVMGTHGRGGLGRVLMGSVAEQVLRKAPCPVMTLRSPAHGELVEAALAVG